MNNQAYIVGALRSSMGRGKADGAFANVHPVDLASAVLKELLNKAELNPDLIEDLIVGCATPTGEQGFNLAKTIAVRTLSDKVSGFQVNRLCGSGLEAVNIAAAKIIADYYTLVACGGVESMSRVPMGSDMLPFPGSLKAILKILTKGKNVVKDTMPPDFNITPMGVSGELIAEHYGFSRKELDEFAYQSHMKAAKAKDSGFFDREIVSINTPKGIINKDEGIRANTSVEKMGTLPSAFKKDGKITAGNSSQITDGAAFLLLSNKETAEKNKLSLRAKILTSKVIGSDPKFQLTGPIDIIPLVLQKAGLKKEDIDLFEINEAFASVVLATTKELKLDPEKVNVNGGAIALGHPLGASGARLLVTLLHELERRKLKRGLAALCIGGSQAIATIIERE